MNVLFRKLTGQQLIKLKRSLLAFSAAWLPVFGYWLYAFAKFDRPASALYISAWVLPLWLAGICQTQLQNRQEVSTFPTVTVLSQAGMRRERVH